MDTTLFEARPTRAAIGAFLIAVTALAVLSAAYVDGDVFVYHAYATQFWDPAHLARRLPLEYPPLAVLAFSLTLIPSGIDFQHDFVGWMTLLFLAGWAAVGRLRSRAAIPFAIFMLIGGLGTLFNRFDLVPALVTLAAIVAVGRGRWTLAHVLLAIGVLLKLYPVFLVPLFVAEQWRRGEGRSPRHLVVPPAAFGLVVGLGLWAAAQLSPAAWASPFRFALDRPLQVESVPATIQWLASGVGFPVHPDRTFNSFNLVGPLDGWLRAASTSALVAGCLLVYLRHLRGALTLRAASLACLCVVVATGKVLSPQYLIWLLPLAALEFELDPVWLGICLLTALIYPVLYYTEGLLTSQLTPAAYNPALLIAVAVRNGLLLIATGRAILKPAHRSEI